MKPGEFVLVKNDVIEFYTRIFSISDPFIYLSETPCNFRYDIEKGELRIKDGGKIENYAGCTIEKIEEGNKETALLVTKRRFTRH